MFRAIKISEFIVTNSYLNSFTILFIYMNKDMFYFYYSLLLIRQTHTMSKYILYFYTVKICFYNIYSRNTHFFIYILYMFLYKVFIVLVLVLMKVTINSFNCNEELILLLIF